MDLLDAAAIGQKLSGSSARTGRRFLDACPISVFIVRGRRYVSVRDFEDWLNSQKIEPQRKPAHSLKSMLNQISDEVLAKRRMGAA
jgi:hypothetical protein